MSTLLPSAMHQPNQIECSNSCHPLPERIAHLALDTFDSLPQKFKPRILTNGNREWTPMSAIVLSRPNTVQRHLNSEPEPVVLKIISFATGTKSLPVSALPKCQGLVLHDCHAEILAFRGLNYWVLCELERMLTDNDYVSKWIEASVPNTNLDSIAPRQTHSADCGFMLKKGVEMSLFSTTAPCGDASMEILTKAAQDAGRDIEPWKMTEESERMSVGEGTADIPPPGRGYFSKLGALRRKPARADAEISMSKSCTDKIMLKQFTGLLNFPVDIFVRTTDEAFLKRMIIYHDQYDAVGHKRAFGPVGRLQTVLEAQREARANFRPFDVEVLPKCFRTFAFSQNFGEDNAGKSKTSNVSALWVDQGDAGKDLVEVLVNGVKQGYRQFELREGKGSAVCRKKITGKAMDIARLLQDRGKSQVYHLSQSSEPIQYTALKRIQDHRRTKDIKEVVLSSLGGWPHKSGEDDFKIEPLSSAEHLIHSQSCSDAFPTETAI